MKRVCIIGGGIAGLAAAHRLAQENLKVILIEREQVAGGLARTVKTQKCFSDLGPHRFHTEIPGIAEFMRSLASPVLLQVERRSRMFFNGTFLSYPPQPFELARRLGVGRMLAFTDSFLFHRIAGLFQRSQRISFEDQMEMSFGPALYREIVYPYTKKVWGIEPSGLSAEVAKTRVSAGGLGKLIRNTLLGTGKTHLDTFTYFRGGCQSLVDLFVDGIKARKGEVLLGSTVTGLKISKQNKVRVMYERNGSPEECEAEVCITTMPLPTLLTMLLETRPDDDLREAVSGLKFINLACVLVEVARPSITDNSWLYFPEERIWINRAYEAKNFDPGMCPEDRAVICAEVSLNDEARWNLPDHVITSNVVTQLAGTGMFEEREVTDTAVHRIPHAYPIYDLTYKKRLSRIWEYLRAFPNLVTTGRQGLFHHNNMDHSILMGRQAAECVLEHHDPAQTWYDSLEQFDSLRIID